MPEEVSKGGQAALQTQVINTMQANHRRQDASLEAMLSYLPVPWLGGLGPGAGAPGIMFDMSSLDMCLSLVVWPRDV